MESNAVPQAEPESNIDTKTKPPTIWKDEEHAKICDLLRVRLEVEKVIEEKLTCPQLFSLISKQLSENGIEKTPIQCQTRWYYHIRFQPEFDNAFRFREAIVSKPKSSATPPSTSKSKVEPENYHQNQRWSKDELKKLKELVLACRSSTPQGQQQHGLPLWRVISQQLESHNIHRSSQACAVKWRRYNSNHASTTTLEIDSDDTLPSLCDSESGIDGADAGYNEEEEEEELRRGSRQRISRPRWTDEEHNKLVELLKARRELESRDENVEKLSCWKLFVHVSKQLPQSFIDRSARACQHYWNSKGFERSGFDINSPSSPHPGNRMGKQSVLQPLSPLGKDIADTFSKLPQQHFDDSLVVKGFRKNLEESATGDKRPRTASDDRAWDDSDDEPIIRAVKRRCSAGDVFGSKRNIETSEAPATNTLGTTPGMVKRRAPKRDPSLPLIKPNARTTRGSDGPLNAHSEVRGAPGAKVSETAEHSDRNSAGYYVMKMKIQDLQDEISSLEKNKQETISEMNKNEPNIQSLRNKIQILQLQKQKLQQSKREKEGQIDDYSSKIEVLATKKKTLEDALDIVKNSI